jgi:hypothetical protein
MEVFFTANDLMDGNVIVDSDGQTHVIDANLNISKSKSSKQSDPAAQTTTTVSPELYTPQQLKENPIDNIEEIVDAAIAQGKPVNVKLARSLGWRSITGYVKSGTGDTAVFHRKGAAPTETKAPTSKKHEAALEEEQRRMEDIRRSMGTPQEDSQPLTLEEKLFEESSLVNGGKDISFLTEFINKLKNKKHVAAMNQMIADLRTKNPDVRFVLMEIDGADGVYFSINNTVYLNKKIFKNEKKAMTVMGHEISHALTQADIIRYVTNRNEATYKEKLDAAAFDNNTPLHIQSLINVYLHSANNLGFEKHIGKIVNGANLSEAPKVSTGEYAFINLEEFVAEAYGSQRFQEQLSEIPYKGTTVWQSIVDAIAQAMSWMRNIVVDDALLLRSDGENALAATMASINKIIQSEIEFSDRFGEPVEQKQTAEEIIENATQEEVNQVEDEVVEQEFSSSVNDLSAQILSFSQPAIFPTNTESAETFESVSQELVNTLTAEDDVTNLASSIISIINGVYDGSQKIKSLIEKAINLSDNTLLKSYLSIEQSVDSAEKSLAAKELGFASWNAAVRKQISELASDFIVGVNNFSTALNNIIFKVANALKAVLIGSAVVSMSGDLAQNSTPISMTTITQSLKNDKFNIDSIPNVNEDSLNPTMAREQYEDPGFSYEFKTDPIIEKIVQQLAEQPTVDFKDSKPSSNVRVVAEWIVLNNDNQGKVFTLADKEAGKIFFFDPQGKLIDSSPALYGYTKGDFLPPGRLSRDTTIDKKSDYITPAGRFETTTSNTKEYGLVADYLKGSATDLAIHRVYLKKPEQKREARLNSDTGKDNRISKGCINLPEDIAKEVIPMLDDSVVYVIPETIEGKKIHQAFSGVKNNINFLPQGSESDSLYQELKSHPVSIELEKLEEQIRDTWTTDIESEERKYAKEFIQPKVDELRKQYSDLPEMKAWFTSIQEDRMNENIAAFKKDQKTLEDTRSSWDVAPPEKIDIQEDGDLSPESIRAAMFKSPTHSTDIESLEDILESGLRSGSALDLTKDKDWAGVGVSVVLPTAKLGRKIEHNNYRESSGVAPVGRVIVDGTNYNSDLRPRLERIASRFPFIPIEYILDDGTIEVIKPKNNINFLPNDIDPSQIKSADPATYDSNGNIIPLSQRFNETKNNINFLPSQQVILSEKMQENFKVGSGNKIYFLPTKKTRRLGLTGAEEKFVNLYEKEVEWNSVFNKPNKRPTGFRAIQASARTCKE